MDGPEPSPELRLRPTVIPTVTVGELEQQNQDLRTLITASLVAGVVLSLSLNLFLLQQMRLVESKLAESRPSVLRMTEEFQKKEPTMKEFINALQTFALANPDFQPTLERCRHTVPQYFIQPVAISSAPTRMPSPSNPIVVPAKPPATR
jgi:hypothetical protein